MKAFFKSPSLLGRVGESPLLFLFLFFQSLMLSAQVTFPVDKNLSLPPEREIHQKVNGEWVTIGTTRTISKRDSKDVERHLFELYMHGNRPLKCYTKSFEGDTLGFTSKDVMFQFFVKAYAEHRPIVLSPDIVWMLIGQGFSHYVNENAEQLRELLVSHQGKQELVVQTDTNLLAPGADWAPALDGMFQKIDENSKGDIANLVVANFSTTGKVERMASQMLLMDVMKSFYEYVIAYISCGIPSITLEGTPDDWQKVLDKTHQLEKYGLGWWVNDLTPILQEFVNASQGRVNQHFWQCIVKTRSIEEIDRGGCGWTVPTHVDGWFLKFFPFNQDGRTPDSVSVTSDNMLAEMVKVPFKYVHTDGVHTEVFPMEFWSGFVGVEENPNTYALRPKIGYMIVDAENEEDEIARVQKESMKFPVMLDVNEFPEILRKADTLNMVQLYYKDSIRVPDWIVDVKVKSLSLYGQCDSATIVNRLQQLLPYKRIVFYSLPYRKRIGIYSYTIQSKE